VTTHRRRPRGLAARRGAALAIVLVAMTVLAALTAGSIVAARQTRRAARDALPQVRAAVAAEGALVEALARWTPRWNQLDAGATDSTTASAGLRTRVRAMRLDARHLLLEATGRTRASTPLVDAERTMSVVARLDPPVPDAAGAITVGGTLDLLAGAVLDGTDASPPGWSRCAATGIDSTAAAVVAPDRVRVDPAAQLIGAIVADARASSASTFTRFASEEWSALDARATVAVPGGSVVTPAPRETSGVCVLAADAWSDPAHASAACAQIHALVVARGALTVRGPARGQGMLLVDGDLTIDGAFDFAGVVVVRGALHAETGALRLHGALLVANGAVLGAGSSVRRSRCALVRATDGVARISVVRRRSWAEVTR
jgi:hypothetical protein